MYAHSKVQFHRECKIAGTVEFIFGNAAAVFQMCTIQTRQFFIDKQTNTTTANGRGNWHERTEFVFHLCAISEESDLKRATEYDGPRSRGAAVKAFVGRPWREYAVTVFMESPMSDIVDPCGWLEWNKTFDSTVYYGEFHNVGPGPVLTDSVKWKGFHAIKSSDVARNYTVPEFLHGDTSTASATSKKKTRRLPEIRLSPFDHHSIPGVMLVLLVVGMAVGIMFSKEPGAESSAKEIAQGGISHSSLQSDVIP
ncbi:hypothetical protein MLD38_037778 [Melastoma candidum]|uniref:Uncharacterized protein n=1 Tax=Melastoma candidum TaxID=119954 RepID=A0ACB9LP21_9MYRT|nr:hypothetical protein MLD38_037778 [Melastoma candidum]